METKRLVLIPAQDIWNKFYGITKDCGDINEGYILKEGKAIPHITLVKFSFDKSIISLNDIWTGLDKKIPRVIFKGFYYDLADECYKWVGVSVIRNEIIEIQNEYRQKLKNMGVNPSERKGNSFYPHLTFLRTKNSLQDIAFRLNDFSFLFEGEIRFHLAIGDTDEIGQVTGVVKSIT